MGIESDFNFDMVSGSLCSEDGHLVRWCALKKWCFYTADMHITEDFHGEWDGDIMG